MNAEQSISIPAPLIEQLQQANHVVVLTGAGTSAESGVPTFREAQTGLWEQYDPQQLATPQAFAKNPQLIWEWYTWRRQLVEEAQPNAGHAALVAMEQHIPKFTLITQNVDGMHQRAGSKHVIELHGNLTRTKRASDGKIVESWESDQIPPRCPETGSLLRPDVVWFGEMLPERALHQATEESAACDIFFSIGTSGVVQPAATLPHIAMNAGATLVVINIDVTPHVSQRTYYIQGSSGKVLPALVKATWR